MGVVGLPAKEDYFKNDGKWPLHPWLSGLKKTRMQYMFRFIHLTEEVAIDIEEPTFLDDVEDIDNDELDDSAEEDITNCEAERDVDEKWYSKAAPLIEKFTRDTEATIKCQRQRGVSN